MTVEISDIERIIAEQNIWRQTKTINLIASENTPSEAVQRVQISDFMGRYAEGHPNQGDKTNRYYQGTRFIDEIESMATKEILDLFNARQADVRPISGNAANTAIALGWLRGGDTIVANSTDAGGHISHGAVGVFAYLFNNRSCKTVSFCAAGVASSSAISASSCSQSRTCEKTVSISSRSEFSGRKSVI